MLLGDDKDVHVASVMTCSVWCKVTFFSVVALRESYDHALFDQLISPSNDETPPARSLLDTEKISVIWLATSEIRTGMELEAPYGNK